MKKIILVIILYLGIFPAVHEGRITLFHVPNTFADDYGGEDPYEYDDGHLSDNNLPEAGSDRMQSYGGSCVFMNMELVADYFNVNNTTLIEQNFIAAYAGAHNESESDVETDGVSNSTVNAVISAFFYTSAIGGVNDIGTAIDDGHPVMGYILAWDPFKMEIDAHEVTVLGYATDTNGNVTTCSIVDTYDGQTKNINAISIGNPIAITGIKP